jgi:hypothetical protein
VHDQLRLFGRDQIGPRAMLEGFNGLAVVFESLPQHGLLLIVRQRGAGPQLVGLALLVGGKLGAVAVQDQALCSERTRQFGLRSVLSMTMSPRIWSRRTVSPARIDSLRSGFSRSSTDGICPKYRFGLNVCGLRDASV